MTGTDSYSTTPATNATADGGAINWAEGQSPSSVNNTARQWMADQRASFNDLAWFQYGTGDQGAGNLAVPAIYASSTSFTIAGADITLVYHVGRRVRAVGSGTGTIYGSISVTSYSPTTTTVTVVWDSGSLSNETLVISLSQIPVTGVPVSAGSISGTKTNNSAVAGSLGEYVESVVTYASPLAVAASAVSQDLTTISLTAGDWDVEGQMQLVPAGSTTTSIFLAGFSTTLNTLPNNELLTYFQVPISGGSSVTLICQRRRFSLASTTTIHFVADIGFAVSTMSICGFINARRVR